MKKRVELTAGKLMASERQNVKFFAGIGTKLEIDFNFAIFAHYAILRQI
jgi:hypothetical protein